jgi:hypothetical protein
MRRARCWAWLIAAMLVVSGPAAACSCGYSSGKSLEQRLDGADRIQLLRIEGAILRPIPEGRWGFEHDTGELFEAPFSAGAVQYGYRVLEVLKGGRQNLPRLWSENISNCGRRLAVGEFVVLMFEQEESEIWATMCNLDVVESLGVYLSTDHYLLDAMRAYLVDRKPIHACDNFVSPPEAIEPICQGIRKERWASEAYRRRPLRSPH